MKEKKIKILSLLVVNARRATLKGAIVSIDSKDLQIKPGYYEFKKKPYKSIKIYSFFKLKMYAFFCFSYNNVCLIIC